MNITEKSAYLKGLAEGLSLDPQKPETKIISALLDLVADMSQKITELEHDVEVLNDYADELDEDLGFVEELLYDDDEDDDDDDEDDDDLYDLDDEDECDFDCAHCDHGDLCFDDEEDEDGDDEEEGFRCLMCPACSEKIYFDESMDPADLICPACGKVICEEDEEDPAAL